MPELSMNAAQQAAAADRLRRRLSGRSCADKERSMTQGERVRVLRFGETKRRIPGPAGEHAVRLLQRGSLDIALSIPVTPVQQTPHAQDELYVIVRGHGVLLHDGNRERVD